MIWSTPASARPGRQRHRLAVGTTPSIEQPNAVEQPATTGTCRGCACSQSMIRRISVIDCAGMRLRLAVLWPSLTETGMLILCAPAL